MPSAKRRKVRPALAPLAAVLGQVVRLRNGLYDAGWVAVHRLSVPVVSIGNLSVGGTGKTPLVALLAARVLSHGRRPAIVSRGHGGSNARRPGGPPLVVSDGTGGASHVSAATCGDEPALLAAILPMVPVVVGRDRVCAGRFAVQQCGADLLLLDDGFQHRRLHRDLDLLTVDAATRLEGARLLPAGPWRERPAALVRAHAVVITRADSDEAFRSRHQEIASIAPHLRIYRSRHVPVALRSFDAVPVSATSADANSSLAALRGRRVAAFAGLARPEGLRRSLETLGASIVRFDSLPDHHIFTTAEVEALVAAGRAAGAEQVITSAKDAVRLPLPDRLRDQVAVLDVEAQVDGIDDLVRRVLDTGRDRPPA